MSAIMEKTKNDWKHLKGRVDYVDLGDEWLVYMFTNEQDNEFVWRERPWFIQGLNLVLKPWEPFLDAYTNEISRVDQWIRNPRLPMELWDDKNLRIILREIGEVIKLDHYTMLKQRGEYARVCCNIDVTKSLRDRVNLNAFGVDRNVPLI